MPKYRALVDLALRKSPIQCTCPNDDERLEGCTSLWHEFFEWPAGTEFEAPKHLKVELGIAKGKFEAVS